MTEPIVQAAIFEGHRRLLDTFREFRAADPGRHPASVDLNELRATAAFLRQEVLPFCRWEEEALEDDREGWETTAFEHAFLAAEIDALAVEVAELERAVDRGRPEDRAANFSRLIRRGHRIEAVLELHMERTEDRGVWAGPPAPGQAASTGEGGA